MISLERARDLLLEGIRAPGEERVKLDCASGRVTSRDIRATHVQPAEPRATRDGIAVGSWSVSRGQWFGLVGEASAGTPYEGVLACDEAVGIATGAVVPRGAQRVIPQEIVHLGGDQEARLLEAPGDDSFIRRAGSDFCNGDLLLPAGTTLHPGALGLVAAANCPSPWVHRRAKIGILTCGDELVAPGSALEPGWTIDSASYALAALVREWGGVAQRIGHVADSAAASEATLTRALPAFDVVITVGGASVGTRDHFRSAARAIGMDLRFEKISVQPGKPCWHARTAWGGLCLGLPGNPTSAFVCAHLLLRPLLARLHGSDRELLRTVRARLAGPPVSSGERRSFQRGWLDDHVGVLMVQAARDQDSGLQSTLASANCLIDLPPHTRLLSGDVVRVLRLGSETGTMTPPGRLVERNGAALHEP